MALTLTCVCGNSLHIDDHLAGRQVQCPSCAAIHTVPGLGRSEPDEKKEIAFQSSPKTPRRTASAIPPIPIVPRRQTLLRSLTLAIALLSGLSSLGIGLFLVGFTLKDMQREVAPQYVRAAERENTLMLVRGSVFLGVGLLGCLGGFCALFASSLGGPDATPTGWFYPFDLSGFIRDLFVSLSG